MTVEDRILERISPDESYRQRVEEVTERLIARLERTIVEETDLPLIPKLVGSVAKGTYLHDPDIDVFVLFPEEATKEEMKLLGLRIGKRAIGGEERYADHPYVHGQFEGFEVDIVPCFGIEEVSRMRTAVDRTPFHTDLVLSRLKKGQRDEVRLLKRFMKGIGTYGADARVEGFSGYLTELLVLRYGSFHEVLGAAKGWRLNESLAVEGRPTVSFDAPLAFQDPVDPDRNVASALTLDNLARFMVAAEEYLGSPDERFFFPRPLMGWDGEKVREEMARRGTSIQVIRLDRPPIIDDNLYPQIRKSLEGICRMLETNDFKVMDCSYHVDGEVLLVVELEHSILPRMRRHIGPPVWVSHSKAFINKWEGRAMAGPFVEGGRWQVFVQREHRTLEGTLRSNLSDVAFGSSFRDAPGLTVLDLEEALERGLELALTEHLDRVKSWKR